MSSWFHTEVEVKEEIQFRSSEKEWSKQSPDLRGELKDKSTEENKPEYTDNFSMYQDRLSCHSCHQCPDLG